MITAVIFDLISAKNLLNKAGIIYLEQDKASPLLIHPNFTCYKTKVLGQVRVSLLKL